MNTGTNSQSNTQYTMQTRSPSSRGSSLWLVLAVIAGAPLAFLAILAVECLGPNREARAIHAAWDKAGGVSDHKVVEMGAGLVGVHLARAGLHFAPVDPRVRRALSAVARARVAVYRLDRRPGNRERCSLLPVADRVMTERGWERLAGVVNREGTVAVYAAEPRFSRTSVDVCVVVSQGEDFVVVTGRAHPEPLLELAFEEAHRQCDDHGSGWPGRR